MWPLSSPSGEEELEELRRLSSGTPAEMRARASEMVAAYTGKFTVPISADVNLIQGWLVKLRKGLIPPRKQ